MAGGLAFNIGNIAGCGLALNVLFGWNVETGAILSGVLAIGIFSAFILFDVERINSALVAKGNATAFEKRLRQGTIMLAATFLFSAVANYLLARWVVTSPAGTEAFNQELGRLTLLSYPIIAIPSMLMMMGLMFWLAREAKTLTGMAMGDMLQGG